MAAGVKLQRRLQQMQLSAAAADVLRTAAVVALHRCREGLCPAPAGQQQQQPLGPRAAGLYAPPAPVLAGDEAGRGRAPEGAEATTTSHGPPGAPSSGPVLSGSAGRDSDVTLVACRGSHVTLQVPSTQLLRLLRPLQGVGEVVSGRLGLRVPLHVNVYHGQRLGLQECQQYTPGGW